jgi:hypothetical protein
MCGSCRTLSCPTMSELLPNLRPASMRVTGIQSFLTRLTNVSSHQRDLLMGASGFTVHTVLNFQSCSSGWLPILFGRFLTALGGEG